MNIIITTSRYVHPDIVGIRYSRRLKKVSSSNERSPVMRVCASVSRSKDMFIISNPDIRTHQIIGMYREATVTNSSDINPSPKP